LAAIDPDVEELLSILLRTPLAYCAQAAIDSIVDETPEEPEEVVLTRDGLRSSFRRRSRYDQLALANLIISSRIKREIKMIERLRGLAPELGLSRISVVPSAEIDGADRPAAVDLLDPRREAALQGFLTAWSAVEGELRQRWGSPDAG
jgi:dynactin complex subunit